MQGLKTSKTNGHLNYLLMLLLPRWNFVGHHQKRRIAEISETEEQPLDKQILNEVKTDFQYTALKFQANFAQHLVVVGWQKFWDFVNLIYSVSSQMLTYNEPFVGRIFCHFYNGFMGGLWVGENFFYYLVIAQWTILFYFLKTHF